MRGLRTGTAKVENPRSEIPITEFATAFEHAPVGMAITDEAAILLHANRALAEMLGYEPRDLVGKSVVDLTHPDDLAASLASNQSLSRGDVTHFSLEKRYLAKGGNIVWARVYVSLLTEGGRRHHLLHAVDVTREKISVDGLRDAEQRFREMAESIEQDFWVMRLEPIELLYTSPAAARLWGFDPMQNRTRPERIVDLVHAEDRNTFAELFEPRFAEPREREYRVVRADGAARWFRTRVFPMRDANGVVDRVTGVTEDVTARKEAEQKVERHRAFERLVMELSAGFVNLAPERMREGFENALRELGELIGAEAGAIFLVDPGGETVSLRYAWSAVETAIARKVFTGFEFGPEHPLRNALVRAGVLSVGDVSALPEDPTDVRGRILENGVRSFIDLPLLRRGELIGLYGFGTLTHPQHWSEEVAERLKIAAELFCNAIDRVRVETEARTHRDALAHALRVGTMGQLAAGIAHELNQPLAAILNYASGCERNIAAGKASTEHVQDTIAKIVEQGMRAADVLKTLRALVRKGEGERTRQDANELIRTALSLIDAEVAAAGIQVRTELAAGLPNVQVDPIQIEQVVLNLLRNALDAVRGGSVARPEIFVRTRSNAPGIVEVRVSDNGPGVAASHRDSIFKEFYTTKPSGLGLGLSISRSIIEAHGGHLNVTVSSAAGATFCFTLPAVG
jgi:PAS domain S-box-containing protein